MQMSRIVLSLLVALFLAACGQEQADETAETAKQPAEATVESSKAESAEAASEKKQADKKDKSAQGIKQRVKAALAGDHRPEEQRARDKYRHPAQTLAFFGLEPDMHVVELWPGGGGWYTAVLAPVIGEEGKLTVASFPPDSEIEYFHKSEAAYRKMLEEHPDVYGDVEVITFMPPDQVKLGEPGSADMVLTFRNLHNWHERGHLPAVFKAAYEVLKPGGVFGVVEHRAQEGTLIEDVGESGYMPEAYVIRLAQETGFHLDGKSEVNANPADTADHPAGVWTLPPSLRYCREMNDGAAKASCMEKYRQIGESDRMTLRFVKPATE